MSTTSTAIYEHGVLRPLRPLSLPERTAVEVRIVQRPARSAKAAAGRQRVYKALQEAGLVKPQPVSEPVQPVSETELAAAAEALAVAGPLAELIIAERAESY